MTQPGTSSTYTPEYDPLGRCVKRTLTVGANTTTTYFVFDGEKPILEFDPNGNLTGKNV